MLWCKRLAACSPHAARRDIDYAVNFPIFARLARQFFPVGPTECSCEEFFSVAGRICNDLRTNLTPTHIEEQACCYYWKREELDYQDKRGEARLQNSNKFASLSIKLQLIPPKDDSGENEALENASGDIAEKMFIAEARNEETAALDFVIE